MLLAASNFNVQGDEESCMGGQYQEINYDIEKSVLEVRTGDLVRFNSKTLYPNICLGELIRSTSGRIQTDELLQKPIFGCFDVRRCVYAQGVVEEPDTDPPEASMWQRYLEFATPSATASGSVEPPSGQLFRTRSEAEDEIAMQLAIGESLLPNEDTQLPRTASAAKTVVTMRPPLPSKRSVPLPQPLTRDEVTDEMIDQVHEPDEAAICNMYNRGITRSQFERMLSPKCGLRL